MALALQPPRHRHRRLAAPLVVAGATLALSVALHLRDPHQQGSWGFCPWLVLTGTNCPGCGGLRAVHHLTHGDVLAAASSNLLLFASLPALLLGWLRWTAGRWRRTPGSPGGPDARRALRLGLAVLALSLAFAVVRNLPGAEWLLA